MLHLVIKMNIKRRNKVFKSQEELNKVPLWFFKVKKWLEKGLTDVFRRCKATSKVRRMLLVLKNLEIRRE